MRSELEWLNEQEFDRQVATIQLTEAGVTRGIARNFSKAPLPPLKTWAQIQAEEEEAAKAPADNAFWWDPSKAAAPKAAAVADAAATDAAGAAGAAVGTALAPPPSPLSP